MKFRKKMNSATKNTLIAALNIELPGDGSVPDWVQLIPAGIEIKGRDGRKWLNDHPESILAAFAAEGKDLPIDWEHASELKAVNGDEAPAAGWMKALEMRGGEIWARVEWTPKATDQIKNKEYRYLSPVFIYEKASGRIVRITSGGLTNQPNLYLAALNQENIDENLLRKEKETMNLAELLAALGLAATTTFEEAMNHVRKLKSDLATALNRAESPSLDKFVPRGDYDKALERATNAETALANKAKADLETAINTEIDAALKAGKITPATKDYHMAQCRSEGGLDRFKTFVAAAPVIGDPSKLDGKKPDGDGGSIDETQRAINAMCGIDEETYKKYAPKEQ
jgi:phage I-like protein